MNEEVAYLSTGEFIALSEDIDNHSHVCFSRMQQINLSCRFPDVVNADVTVQIIFIKLFRLSTVVSCIPFSVAIGMGIWRPLIYIFVESEIPEAI